MRIFPAVPPRICTNQQRDLEVKLKKKQHSFPATCLHAHYIQSYLIYSQELYCCFYAYYFWDFFARQILEAISKNQKNPKEY